MRKSRLSWYKQKRLIELFIAGTTARTASSLVGVNKTTASFYFYRLRVIIFEHQEHMEMFDGEVETDSIVYTDTWRSYNTLDVSEFKHYRINHSQLFADKTNHINDIENF